MGQKPNIAWVDYEGNFDFQGAFIDTLREEGYSTVKVSWTNPKTHQFDVQRVIKLAGAKRIVIIHFGLRGISDKDAQKIVRRLHERDCKVIVMSVSNRVGANGVLCKPFTLDEMLEEVGEMWQ